MIYFGGGCVPCGFVAGGADGFAPGVVGLIAGAAGLAAGFDLTGAGTPD